MNGIHGVPTDETILTTIERIVDRDSLIDVARSKLFHAIKRWFGALSVADGSPIAMRLTCPVCHELHIDEGEFATRPHHTHACQSCGHVWRPAVVPTVGVRFLPGFKNEGGAR